MAVSRLARNSLPHCQQWMIHRFRFGPCGPFFVMLPILRRRNIGNKSNRHNRQLGAVPGRTVEQVFVAGDGRQLGTAQDLRQLRRRSCAIMGRNWART